MRPFDARMLIVQALSEARMTILRLRSLSMLARDYGMDASMISRLNFVLALVEGVASEMEEWLKAPRLVPDRILALMQVVRIAQRDASGLHPEVDLGLSQISSSLAHLYSIASEDPYGTHPDSNLVERLVERARRAAEVGDTAP